MDAKERTLKVGEIGMSEKKNANGGEVVISVSSEEAQKSAMATKEPKGSSSKDSESSTFKQSRIDSPGHPKSLPVSCPSPEISRFTASPNKPPKIPTNNETLVRRKTFAKSVYSKSKSRFGDEQFPIDASMFDENQNNPTLQEQVGANSPNRNLSNRASPNNKSMSRMVSITPKMPFMASPGGPGEDDDEEFYKKANIEFSKEKHKRVKTKVLVEWTAFGCIVGCLVASLTVEKSEKFKIWGLECWKWCVLVMVIFCGMLLTNRFMHFVVFLIERNFLLKKKVLYFVHGLKKSVQVFIWLSFVLLTWVLLFNRGFNGSPLATKILDYITWTLVSLLIGAFLWLLKTLLLKLLAVNFHVNTFFDRIQDSLFHQYILITLSGRPLIEEAERIGRESSTGQMSFRSVIKDKLGKEKEAIDVEKLYKMKQEKVSSWTMKVLVDAVTNSGLSTISNALDECVHDGGGEQTDKEKEITNEMEAMAAAYRIFRNVAQPGCKYFDEEDLMRFMIKEEVDRVFQLFGGSETGQIDIKALTNWVVKVYKDRKALAHALSDTKTAVKQLGKLVTGILIIVTIIIWLLLMEIANTKVLFLLSSQLVVAAFMFGNTCKTIFEGIIFVFVMHPFDVGDRCVVDGVQLMVEEMNLLTTVFLKLDNEKLYYPNSVLATKPISNYYRSPNMGDNVEFSIDFMTPAAKIGELKEKIKEYLEKNPQHWQSKHIVVVKEIENVNKLKMAVFVNHTINFQDFAEKTQRRTELVMGLKQILEELHIKYHLLPQEINVRPMEPVTSETNKLLSLAA